jgi:hypothetical protein
MFRIACVCAVLVTLSSALAAVEGAPQPPAAEAPPTPSVSAADVLSKAQAALKDAGAVKASLKLEVWYPAHYSSVIDLYAAPSGDERAEIATTVNADSYKNIEVISGGVLWTEESTPVGTVASKIDIGRIKSDLAKSNEPYAALPALGANALFDLAALSRLVDFTDARESELDGHKVFVFSGALAKEFQDPKTPLPAGARRWYKSAVVYVGEDFLPRRIELGLEDGKPLLRLDFTSLEKNVSLPPGVFDYTPPKDAEVVDRTGWALSQLQGK